MNYFENKLDLILEEQENIGYYNPDYLYQNASVDGITFLYFNGNLTTSENTIPHWEILVDMPETVREILRLLPEETEIDLDYAGNLNMQELQEQVPPRLGLQLMDKSFNVSIDEAMDLLQYPVLLERIIASTRDDMEKVALFGRSGSIYEGGRGFANRLEILMPEELPLYYFSFWLAPPNIDLDDCIEQVSELNNPKNLPVWISAPSLGTVPYGQHENRREMDKDEINDIQMQRLLHMMKPAEKKQAMKKLGLASGGARSPGQRAGLTPGQKYWAMSSEDRK